MDLPMQSSISQIGETQWLIGHDHICELQDFSTLQDDVLCHWRDPSGRTFQVRSTSSMPATIPIQPFYSAGTSAAVWEFAGLIWKVKSWAPDTEDEAQTISFVKDTFPTIPVPEIICYWTEVSGKRSFMAMKRAPGETLDVSWRKLSDSERKTVASDLADYTLLMARVRRDALESVSGYGVTDAFIKPDSCRLPTFRLKIDEATEYFQPLEIDEGFVFTHGDLNPGNLLIDEGKISCILDWEFAGFFPKWWINYKARISAMSLSSYEPSHAWIDAIRSELEIRGIMLDFDRYKEWACKKK